MKLYISNFYQIRHFSPTIIPLSTTVYDQPWYHDFTRDNTHVFINKKGVLCGLRIDCLRPRDTSCRGQPCDEVPNRCKFMTAYRQQLQSINFKEFLSTLKELEAKLQAQLNINEELTFVFIVYESESTRCSERQVLKAWFESNHMKLNEWKHK